MDLRGWTRRGAGNTPSPAEWSPHSRSAAGGPAPLQPAGSDAPPGLCLGGWGLGQPQVTRLGVPPSEAHTQDSWTQEAWWGLRGDSKQTPGEGTACPFRGRQAQVSFGDHAEEWRGSVPAL